jgi:ubiquinone/menaquinone biosynthesis C-methylase UbiE
VNRAHLEFCSSAEWREMLRDAVIPYAMGRVSLGDDVLEIGPGPGMTTDLLRSGPNRLTAVEVDAELAEALATRFAGTNVEVVNADATELPFEDGRFTGAVSLTMLHHVPTRELQDQLLAEVARVLRPGGRFVASDSVATRDLAMFHQGDTYNPVDPATLGDRLRTAGLAGVEIQSNAFGWSAQATRP